MSEIKRKIRAADHDGLWELFNQLDKSMHQLKELGANLEKIKKDAESIEEVRKDQWINVEKFLMQKGIVDYEELKEYCLELDTKNKCFTLKEKTSFGMFMEQMFGQN